jgi:succinoglycan biosynthesis protein ExoM
VNCASATLSILSFSHKDSASSEAIGTKMGKIVICVCTAKRPRMLSACLHSLIQQAVPAGRSVEVAVIDNEPEPNNQGVVLGIADAAPFPIHYVHHPERGIPQARNAALDKALALGAEWIAFIDDDETARPDWVAALYYVACGQSENAGAANVPVTAPAQRRPVDVVMGPVHYVYPEEAGGWRKRSQYGDREKKQEGQELPRAAANNVIFSTRLVREKGLRFAEELRFAGSEDTVFFRQLHEAGARIIWSFKPVVYETVTWERITFRGHIRKAFRRGVATVASSKLFEAKFGPQRHLFRAFKRGAMGVGKLLAAPFALILGPSRAMHIVMSGCRNLAEAAGVVAGLRRRKSNYYENIAGF